MRSAAIVGLAGAVAFAAAAAPAQEADAPPALTATAVLGGHGGAVTGAAWSPDGTRVATACGDGVVRLYGAADGALQRELRGHAGPVWAIAWTPDGSRVVSGGQDGTARIWTVGDGVQAHVLDHRRPGGVLQVHVVSEEFLLLVGGNPTPQVWRLRDGAKVGDLHGHVDVVWSVAHAGGRWVATGSQDRTVRVWDLHGQQAPRAFGEAKDHPANSPNLGPGSPVLAVALSPDGTRVWGAHRDGSRRLWSEAMQATSRSTPASAALAIACAPDGERVAIGFANGGCTVESEADGAGAVNRTFWPAHTDWVQQVVFSPDGRLLATGSWDRTVALRRVADGACLGIARGHEGWITAVAFAPDGTRLLTVAGDRTVRLWSVPE